MVHVYLTCSINVPPPAWSMYMYIYKRTKMYKLYVRHHRTAQYTCMVYRLISLFPIIDMTWKPHAHVH